MFLYVAYQSPHFPMQNSAGTEERNAHIQGHWRRKLCGMISHTDDGLARIIAAFRAKGMWEDNMKLTFSDL